MVILCLSMILALGFNIFSVLVPLCFFLSSARQLVYLGVVIWLLIVLNLLQLEGFVGLCVCVSVT